MGYSTGMIGRARDMQWSDLDPRVAEARMWEHIQRRPQLGLAPPAYALPASLHTPWDTDTNRPPPAEYLPDRPGESRSGPSTAPDRRSARFRDGLPPPPPLPPPIRDADVLGVAEALGIAPNDPHILEKLHTAVDQGVIPPLEEAIRGLQTAMQAERQHRASKLLPQDLFDSRTTTQTPHPSAQGQVRPHLDARSGGPRTGHAQRESARSERVATAPSREGLHPSPGPVQPTPPLLAPPPPRTYHPEPSMSVPLSKSQKRRLRRHKSNGSNGSNGQFPPPTPGYQPAPPLPEQAGSYVSPTYPGMPPPRPSCAATLQLTLPDPSFPDSPYVLTLSCPLNPWPHPNQPHLVELPPECSGGARVFVGWDQSPDHRS